MLDRTGTRRRSALRAGAFVALTAAAIVACSSSGSGDSGGADAGGVDATCGPLPESISVGGGDCVATLPNPCCAGFYGFACAALPDGGGGPTCSETRTCVRAGRYDQSVCGGAQAYSCPDLNGTNYATLTTPGCQQMEVVGPVGEGIRWCCGSNLPPANLDASGPPNPDAGTPVGDGSTDGGDAAG